MDGRTARTEKNRAILLAALGQLEAEHRRPPTYKELCALTGISPAAITRHVAALEEAGLVRRLPGTRGVVSAAPGLTAAHEAALAAVDDAGNGRPATLKQVAARLSQRENVPDLARVLLDDLVRRNRLMRTGRGYVRVEEPSA